MTIIRTPTIYATGLAVIPVSGSLLLVQSHYEKGPPLGVGHECKHHYLRKEYSHRTRETGVRKRRELPRSYLLIKDLTRVMNRLKAMYRSWAIACAEPQMTSKSG